jgi:hypothetical protein
LTAGTPTIDFGGQPSSEANESLEG